VEYTLDDESNLAKPLRPIYNSVPNMERAMALRGKPEPASASAKLMVTCTRCGRDIISLTAERPKAEFAAPCKGCGRRHFYQPSDVKAVELSVILGDEVDQAAW
jgi:DNA-directed RNA polymerase subunit RPC12/RpoP